MPAERDLSIWSCCRHRRSRRKDWLKHCTLSGYSSRRALLDRSTLHSWRRQITSATKPTLPGSIPDYEPFPFPQRKKRRKVGPFSKRLSFAMLDLRTQEGRYARDICDGIAADLGGAPNCGSVAHPVDGDDWVDAAGASGQTKTYTVRRPSPRTNLRRTSPAPKRRSRRSHPRADFRERNGRAQGAISPGTGSGSTKLPTATPTAPTAPPPPAAST